MAELVRTGEMDFPAGRMVFVVHQGRAYFASVSAVQKMVSPGQPSEPNSAGRSGNNGADCMGGGYGGEFAAI